MNAVDYDAISIPEEPIFVPQDLDSDHNSFYLRTPTLSIADSISMAETRSFSSSLRSKTNSGSLLDPGSLRQCVLEKQDDDEHGFFLAVDRDRNGQIIRRLI